MPEISVGGVKYTVAVSSKANKADNNKDVEKQLPDFAQKYIQTEDKVSENKNNKGSIPQTDNNISKSFGGGVLTVGKNTFGNIKKITNQIDLEEAKNIVKDNKIDEIFFKTQEGDLFLAYGDKSSKGALEMGTLKEGYIGRFNNQPVKIVHIDNEINTVKEGALSPLTSTWKNVKDASATGIAKGVTEMGTTLVAIFVGKSVIENGISAVSAAKGAAAAGHAAKGSVNIIKTGSKIVGNAGQTGKAIAVTVGGGLQKLAIGGLVAGAVVGTVVGTMSAVGAVRARNPHNDFTTIEMVTNPDLSYTTKPKQ